MTREGASKKPPSVDADDPAALRRAAEEADRQLIRLMNERAVLATKLESAQVAATRSGSARGGDDVPAAARDAAHAHPAPPQLDGLLADVERWNEGPLSGAAVQAVYRELAGGWRALGKRPRVAFLGPAYTYSHLATLHRFSHSVDPIPVGNIAAVFEEVVRGQSEFGVVPVENSTDGRIADTLDMFTRLRVRICGEVPLRIHHSLLGRGDRADIVEVQSKPQALSQCRNWLARHLPAARLVEVASTVTAAQTARERPGIAAIASAQAGAFYGLDVLAENIEDNTSNITRFFVIGEESAARTGRDKMSAMFEVPHKPGALADAMNIFKKAKLNLTWIESFPIARPEGGYLFFIELDGHETEAKVKKALAALEKKTLRLEVLGSYPRSEPVG